MALTPYDPDPSPQFDTGYKDDGFISHSSFQWKVERKADSEVVGIELASDTAQALGSVLEGRKLKGVPEEIKDLLFEIGNSVQ